MYFQGAAQQFGPGDALIERYGMSGYVPTPNFFDTPAGVLGIRGLGCSCAGRGCDCEQRGLGLFEAGFDVTQWGPGEWAIAVIGGYFLFSAFYTTGQAVSYAKSVPGKRRKARADALRKRAKEIESRKGFF